MDFIEFMQCWNCGAVFDAPFLGKTSFRATCEACHAALHCCTNCRHFQPGRANSCLIPNTESVNDRTANNFCEDFSLLGKVVEKNNSEKEKQCFNALFKD